MIASTKAFPLARRRTAYIGLAVLMSVIAIVGFWPTYFGPLFAGSVAAPFIIHFHAAVFVGWLAIFIAQVSFAATGHIAWHLRLGRSAIVYGCFLIVVGLATGIIRAAERPAGADAQFLLSTIMDMVVFGLFFVVAVAYRRQPEIHKRAMIVAATMLLIAPTARFWFLPELALPAQIRPSYFFWVLPMLAAVGYDLMRRRRVHPIYVAGFITAFFRILIPRTLGPTDTWTGIAEQIFRFWIA